MHVLVIPDVHLKPWMFDAADAAIKQEPPDAIVQLGDLPDDWGMQRRPDAYDALYERAEAFLAAHPDAYWCYGNHDMSYFWDAPESGMAKGNVLRHVQERSRAFWDKVPQDRKAFVHRIDNVCFSHAGILRETSSRTKASLPHLRIMLLPLSTRWAETSSGRSSLPSGHVLRAWQISISSTTPRSSSRLSDIPR